MSKQMFKFRGWWIRDYDEEIEPMMMSHRDIMNYTSDEEIQNGNVIIMQFTGLYDDSGKEIYESDIIEIQDKGETKTSYISQVYFNYDGATVKHHPHHEALGHTGLRLLSYYCDYGFGDEYKYGCCKCKVIGNIYENKDLLENK